MNTAAGDIRTRYAKTKDLINRYLRVVKAMGNYYERQALGMSNVEIDALLEEGAEFIGAAVATGVLAEAFCEQLEHDIGPTHGRSIPERFQRFRLAVEQATGEKEGRHV